MLSCWFHVPRQSKVISLPSSCICLYDIVLEFLNFTRYSGDRLDVVCSLQWITICDWVLQEVSKEPLFWFLSASITTTPLLHKLVALYLVTLAWDLSSSCWSSLQLLYVLTIFHALCKLLHIKCHDWGFGDHRFWSSVHVWFSMVNTLLFYNNLDATLNWILVGWEERKKKR